MQQSVTSIPQRLRAPGPRGHMLLGNLNDFTNNLLGAMERDFRLFGEVVRYRVGPLTIHFLSNPELAHHVLIEHQREFPKLTGKKGLGVVVGNGLIANDGDSWLIQRRMMQPMFHRKRLATMADKMAAAGARMLERWAGYSPHQPVNVATEMFQVTLDIIMQTMFSADVMGEVGKIGPAVTTAIEFAAHKIQNPFSAPIGWPTKRNREYAKAKQCIDDMIYRLINERRTSGHGEGDLLDMLLEARDAETGEQMSDQQVRDEVLTIFAAGHETTANTLTFAWYVLSQYPEIRARLQHELDTVLQGRQPTVEDLPQLPYTNQVFKEAMRLYPAAPIVGPRINLHESTFNGYTIPANSWLIVSIFNIHRHPDFWEQPLVFDPERFSPERSAGRHSLAFMPFGAGPRKCIGNNLADMEGALLLATVAQRYELEHVAGHQVQPEMAITLRSKTGMPMHLRPR